MSIKVLFFGKLGEIAHAELGTAELSLNGINDIHQLKQHIQSLSNTLFEELENPANLTAINQEICKTNSLVNANDEIAFMSPLSGG